MGIVNSSTVNLPDKIKDLIVLYAHLVESLNKINDLKSKAKPISAEEVRHHRLEARVNLAFAELTDQEQRLIIDELVIKKLEPESTKTTLQIFQGRITKIYNGV